VIMDNNNDTIMNIYIYYIYYIYIVGSSSSKSLLQLYVAVSRPGRGLFVVGLPGFRTEPALAKFVDVTIRFDVSFRTKFGLVSKFSLKLLLS
jgi:hypothetical protein